MRFHAILQSNGKTATGIQIPDGVVAAIGRGKKPPVRVTINGHTYRSTVASRGDRFLVGVSAENRTAAGVSAGDELTVDIELDSEPRDVAVPPDLDRALKPHAKARRFFDGLSASKKQWFVHSVESAKTPETRQRRIDKAVELLLDGRSR
jgi:hypothetical protein